MKLTYYYSPSYLAYQRNYITCVQVCSKYALSMNNPSKVNMHDIDILLTLNLKAPPNLLHVDMFYQGFTE